MGADDNIALFFLGRIMSEKIDHLSVSQVNEYLGCSQQYYFHRIAELEPYDTPSALVVGSAIHAAIEHFNVLKRDGTTASLQEMQQVFEHVLREEEKAPKPVNYGSSCLEEQVSLGGPWLQAFLEVQSPLEKVKTVEESFEITLPGLAIPVVGRVDAVLEDPESIIVVDYKTAATKPSISDVEANLQMTLYGIWAKRRWPNREIKLRMDYVVKAKRSPTCVQVLTSRTAMDEQRCVLLFQKVYNHIQMLRAEVIDPLPVPSWKCAGCGYRKVCMVQETKVA